MGEKAIQVRGLGKEYQIGTRERGYTTFRDAIVNAFAAPFRRLRQLSGSTQEDASFWALKDVSFDVEPGEVVGIIGRNGAGKSTLLKILSQITEPTTGEIKLNGRVASLLEVGTGFHPELTGRENIYLNGSILGMSRAEIKKKFDEIVAFAEVEKFLDTPVKRYSSGMYVRLAFAVAAHLEPEILIVDEVLAVGDVAFQKKCLGKMGEVAEGGRTVLFVSHSMTAVCQLCTKGILLRSGQLYLQGSVEAVSSEYMADASTTSGGTFDLRQHVARSSNHRPIIQSITLLGREGVPTTIFDHYSPLTVEMRVVLERPVAEPRVAVAIEDHLGRRITSFASYFEKPQLPTAVGEMVLRCEVSELRLGSGRYLISVSFGTKRDGLHDSVDGAGWFTVAGESAYPSGEPYHTVYGPVLHSSNWTAKPSHLIAQEYK
jgi:lipopolysaccharide transport system ATP-binding protein